MDPQGNPFAAFSLIVAPASLVRGSVLLVRETSIAVRVIGERAASVRARARLQ